MWRWTAIIVENGYRPITWHSKRKTVLNILFFVRFYGKRCMVPFSSQGTLSWITYLDMLETSIFPQLETDSNYVIYQQDEASAHWTSVFERYASSTMDLLYWTKWCSLTSLTSKITGPHCMWRFIVGSYIRLSLCAFISNYIDRNAEPHNSRVLFFKIYTCPIGLFILKHTVLYSDKQL